MKVFFINGIQVSEPEFKDKMSSWPILLQPLKVLAKPTDSGLGDIIERTIGPMNSEAFKKWYRSTFGRDCNCNARKEIWNRRYPL